MYHGCICRNEQLKLQRPPRVATNLTAWALECAQEREAVNDAALAAKYDVKLKQWISLEIGVRANIGNDTNFAVTPWNMTYMTYYMIYFTGVELW